MKIICYFYTLMIHFYYYPRKVGVAPEGCGSVLFSMFHWNEYVSRKFQYQHFSHKLWRNRQWRSKNVISVSETSNRLLVLIVSTYIGIYSFSILTAWRRILTHIYENSGTSTFHFKVCVVKWKLSFLPLDSAILILIPTW